MTEIPKKPEMAKVTEMTGESEIKSFFGWVTPAKEVRNVLKLISSCDTLEKLAMCDELVSCFFDQLNQTEKRVITSLGERGTPTQTQIKIINRWRKQLRSELLGT